MIISYKNNFALIAIPKCGTHSIEPAVRMSGILDPSIDVCTRLADLHDELNFHTIHAPWTDLLEKRLFTFHTIHASWTDLLEKKLVTEDMQCIAVVRHPVDRFLSIVSFTLFNEKGVPQNIKTNHAISPDEKDIYNCFWDNCYSSFGTVNQPCPLPLEWRYWMRKQTSFLNNDPTVYKMENMAPRITELIESFGGNAPPIGHENKSKPRPANDRLLTKDRQQQILDFYQDDFILWENAK